MSKRIGFRKGSASVLLAVFIFWVAPGVRTQGQETQATEPTKADLVKTLETLLPLLEAENYTAAAEYVMMPPTMNANMLSGILKANELSLPGIKRLARDAKFGKATELFGAERAAILANKMGADVNQCYGFNHETKLATAEIIAQWDGSKFKLVRIDDVGKLAGVEADMNSKSAADPKPETGAENEDSDAVLKRAALAIQEFQAAVEQNPNDVASRAKLAMALYQIGNYPAAWTQLMAANQVEPNHVGVTRGLDAMINEFTRQGVFTVGVPTETVQALLGEPSDVLDLKARTRWRYAHWGIDFSDGRVGEIIDLRGADKALFEPTEKISTDLGGQTWNTGFRRKEKGKSVAYYFVPGETISNYTQLITVERLLDVPGTMEAIGRKLIEDEEKLVPGSMHRVLQPGEDSMILAAKIPGNPKSQTRHQLIRLWKGPKDLFRLTYTAVSEDDPSQETQQKWMGIFQKATLDRIE